MRPPIADPFEPPLAESETRVFKHKFWPVYLGTTLLTVGMVVPLLALWPLMRQIFWSGSQVFLLFYLLIINPLIAALSMTFLHPTRITREGVQGPPMIGFVAWSQIKTVRSFWLGLPYARVTAREHFFALWIPLTFADRKGFAQTIEEWVPADNPLRLWVQKRGF